GVALLSWDADLTRCMAEVEESRQTPAFRFVCVDWKDIEVPSAGRGDMGDAPPHRVLVPRIHDVEYQRRLHRNRRMQAARRLPGPVADARDKLSNRSRGMQRHAPTVARDDVARVGQVGYLPLHSFHRGIYVSHRPSSTRFFSHDVPRFERLTQLEVHAAARHGAVERESKLKL